ncbi:zinc dependent phospholipase C family protein [Paenibacillus sp. MMS20-IR301]|uniref:zinc dependent phospholipase C family protein n=1 Tax=Paenibacillus sp. MMS20-IR301 TaxID=2895946 RepID=UPI0028EC0F00|nr:zinc dependent phospholipase C family protein [Paenibacillus sp. MMS20-IR301]WNS46274.1 zinc dependent phospholipase C family protein [Paenibacillus sp. MMS20-IR301]
MPNIWMHIQYGQQLAGEFSSRFPFLSSLEQYSKLYNLGCQGPDYLLYHSFLPWRQDIGALHLGDLMHSQHCGPVLLDFWKAARMLKGEEAAQTQLYFLGFLTHHLLDRNLHPYINWKAGYKYRDHQRFEIDLDMLFMKRLRGINIWQHPAWTLIDSGPQLAAPVHHILHTTAQNHYPEAMRGLSEEIWHSSYRDMVLAHRYLYDPKGWKKALTWGRTRRLFTRRLSSREQQLDYLNEQHAEWRHSAVHSEVRTESVPELWEQALAEGRIVLGALADWLDCTNAPDAQHKLEQFSLLLGNRSYDTGKECSLNLQNIYAEPIWTALEDGCSRKKRPVSRTLT